MGKKEIHSVPLELLAEMDEAVRQVLAHRQDPEEMRRACERMDRMREGNRQRFGIQDIAVDLIREARDGE